MQMSKRKSSEYRTRIDGVIESMDKEIDTSLTYISIGALGFFLTINEKFIKLTGCSYKIFLIISAILLLGSFVILLIKKYTSVKYSKKILDSIDEMIPDENISDKDILDQVTLIWEESEKKFLWINTTVYLSLSIGVVLQVAFFLINFFNKESLEEKHHIEHVIILNDLENVDTILISNDTVKIYGIKSKGPKE
jgi:hypothetical protein